MLLRAPLVLPAVRLGHRLHRDDLPALLCELRANKMGGNPPGG